MKLLWVLDKEQYTLPLPKTTPGDLTMAHTRQSLKRNILFACIFILVVVARFLSPYLTSHQEEPTLGTKHTIQEAHTNRNRNVQVEGVGTIVKVLPDNLDGSRHQRIIVRITPDHTVLVAHNIDIAPRIPNLRLGDEIAFSGEYEWNAKGGVLH